MFLLCQRTWITVLLVSWLTSLIVITPRAYADDAAEGLPRLLHAEVRSTGATPVLVNDYEYLFRAILRESGLGISLLEVQQFVAQDAEFERANSLLKSLGIGSEALEFLRDNATDRFSIYIDSKDRSLAVLDAVSGDAKCHFYALYEKEHGRFSEKEITGVGSCDNLNQFSIPILINDRPYMMFIDGHESHGEDLRCENQIACIAVEITSLSQGQKNNSSPYKAIFHIQHDVTTSKPIFSSSRDLEQRINKSLHENFFYIAFWPARYQSADEVQATLPSISSSGRISGVDDLDEDKLDRSYWDLARAWTAQAGLDLHSHPDTSNYFFDSVAGHPTGLLCDVREDTNIPEYNFLLVCGESSGTKAVVLIEPFQLLARLVRVE